MLKVGVASGTTSATLPAHAIGDIIIAWVFRDGSTTAPTLPSGWTSLFTGAGTTCCVRLAWRRATATNTATGTWTNATSVHFIVLRADSGYYIEPGVLNGTAGTTNTITYSALTGMTQNTRSIIHAFAAHRSTDTTLETAPTLSNLTVVDNYVNATNESVIFASTAQNSFTQRTVAITGTASGWMTRMLEIREFTAPVNTAAPTISGATESGSSLSSNQGTWTNGGALSTPGFAWQWMRDGVAIPGETASNYTTVNADVGKTITFRVRATNNAGTTEAVSSGIVVTAASSGYDNPFPSINSPFQGDTTLPGQPFHVTFGPVASDRVVAGMLFAVNSGTMSPGSIDGVQVGDGVEATLTFLGVTPTVEGLSYNIYVFAASLPAPATDNFIIPYGGDADFVALPLYTTLYGVDPTTVGGKYSPGNTSLLTETFSPGTKVFANFGVSNETGAPKRKNLSGLTLVEEILNGGTYLSSMAVSDFKEGYSGPIGFNSLDGAGSYQDVMYVTLQSVSNPPSVIATPTAGVRFDAAGEGYTRAITNLDIEAYTIAGWAKMSANDGHGVLGGVNSLADSADVYLNWNADSEGMMTGSYKASGGDFFDGSGNYPPVGDWFFWAIRSYARNVEARWRLPTHTEWSKAGSALASNATFVNGTLRVNTDAFGSYGNRVQGPMYVYPIALTDTELLLQMTQLAPIKTTWAYYPFNNTTVADNANDQSGNNRNLTPSGTLTYEEESGGPTNVAVVANNVASTSHVSSPAVVINRNVEATSVASTTHVGTPAALINRSFTANNIASNTSVGNPAVTVTAITNVEVTANNVSAQPSVGTPAAVINRAVTANGVASQPSVGVPAAVVGVAVSANGVSSQPSVGSPSAVINKAVTANSVASDTSVGSPAALINRAMVANNVASDTSVGTPAVSQQHNLSANSVASTSHVGTPAAVVNRHFVANPVAASPSVGTPAVSQQHNLSANGVSAQPSVGTPSVVINRHFNANSVSSATSVGTPAVSQQHALVAQPVSAQPSVGSPAALINRAFVANSIASTTHVGTPGVGSALDVQANSVASNTTVGSPAVGIIVNAVANPVASQPSVGSPAVLVNRPVVANSIASASSVGSPAAAVNKSFAAVGVASQPTVGSPTVTQQHALVANRIASGSFVGTPAVTVNVQFNALGVSAQPSVGTPELVQNHNLLAVGVASQPSVGMPSVYIGGNLQAISIAAKAEVGTPAVTINVGFSAIGVASQPEVGQPLPSIGKAVVANPVTAQPSVGTPVFGRMVNFIAQSVASAPNVGVPAAHIIRNIMAQSVASNTTVGRPAFGRTVHFQAQGVSTSTWVANPAAQVIVNFNALDVSTETFVGSPAIQVGTLIRFIEDGEEKYGQLYTLRNGAWEAAVSISSLKDGEWVLST